ncbi:MAG: hypothetical protein H6822_25435 [Planctomycetaceae bacterium]|nr:hypothetical protein [Planctomycetales bacterium]MCB9925518.1 hypothetical protein [Planctomycetaceae bacterium]
MPTPIQTDANSWLPRMSWQEVGEMTRYLVRLPELFTLARDRVDRELFDGDDEKSYRVVWEMTKWLVNEHGIDVLASPSFPQMLGNGLKNNLNRSNDEEDIYIQLFGAMFNPYEREVTPSWSNEDPDDCDEDYEDEVEDELDEDDSNEPESDEDDSPGPWAARCWFELAFGASPETLDVEYGRLLLVRFLKERTLTAALDATLECGRERRDVPGDWTELMGEVQRRLASIESIEVPRFTTVGEQWHDHERELDLYRGRELIGLKTGLNQLDQRTLGLRGIGALGSPPNVGKTALCVEIALGVCHHHADNDAVVVFLALDMPKRDIYSRIKCNLADMEASRFFLGSPNARPNTFFDCEDRRRLQTAEQRMADEQIGTRLLVLDRSDLREDVSADRLASILSDLKGRNSASRALLIVDYLQIIPVPESGGTDLEQDKERIRVMQDVVAKTTTESNPLGDTVLFISEARKPPSSKETWGGSLAEFMGTARLTYAIDYAILYSRMVDKDMPTYYGIAGAPEIERRYNELDAAGIAPATVTLVKGRDGMTKGRWGMEFHFKKSIHRDLEPQVQDAEAAEYGCLADPGEASEHQRIWDQMQDAETEDEDIGISRRPQSAR